MLTAALIWGLAGLLVAAGLVGAVLPLLPGPLLLFLGLLTAAWAEQFRYVGTRTLIVLGLLAAAAHAIDFIAGSVGAKRYGASPAAVFGAALGALVGIFFGLPGVLLGPFVGAVLGELASRGDLDAAGRAGIGATIGLILGTAAKLALGFAMIGIFVIVRLL
jgi:uncharacterized protein YqgC (DUF456 family)